jgi:hypothetical protein
MSIQVETRPSSWESASAKNTLKQHGVTWLNGVFHTRFENFDHIHHVQVCGKTTDTCLGSTCYIRDETFALFVKFDIFYQVLEIVSLEIVQTRFKMLNLPRFADALKFLAFNENGALESISFRHDYTKIESIEINENPKLKHVPIFIFPMTNLKYLEIVSNDNMKCDNLDEIINNAFFPNLRDLVLINNPKLIVNIANEFLDSLHYFDIQDNFLNV